jgi:hypothetical protein
MKLCSFETAKTATIDGCIDLDGTRAPVNAAIIRDPSTTGIPNMCRLSTQTLLAVAAAYPLEPGDRVCIGGLPLFRRSSERAVIEWGGERGRLIMVVKDPSAPRHGNDRLLSLECFYGISTLAYPLEVATDDRVVRTLCLELRKRKSAWAEREPTLDGQGNILIPRGAVKRDGTEYLKQYKLVFRPRLFAWDYGTYRRYSIGQLMKMDPKLGELAKEVFDALPPREKARVLGLTMAA